MHGQEIDRPCYPELALVLLTGAGHVALELSADGMRGAADTLDRPQQIYNLVAAILWGCYVLFRMVRTPSITRVWGFRRANFVSALTVAVLFAVPACAVMIWYGVWKGNWPIPATFWVLLVVYPVWGLGQQFALQALITKNLRGMVSRVPMRAVAAGVVFSVSHFPNFLLMALTLPAGIAFTWIFEKKRNIWAIGLMHGLMGALAYYLVLGKDPGAEIVGFLR
ncbi:lysostaphin resistance A-like protein [Verrucomicrobiota bacterium]